MKVEKPYRHLGWKIKPELTRAAHASEWTAASFQKETHYSPEGFGLTKQWIEEELGELIDFYKLNDESAHSLGPRTLGVFKTPPRHVQQPKADEQKPVAYNGGSYFHPVEALNRHEQGERDVAIARAKRHHPAPAAVGTADLPSEEE